MRQSHAAPRTVYAPPVTTALPQVSLLGALTLATALLALAPSAFGQTTAPAAPTPKPAEAAAPAAAPEPKPADAAAEASSTQGMSAAKADIAAADGTAHGTATIEDTASGLLHVTLDLTALPPGEMAVHIHQVGKCEGPKFESAEGHLTGGNEHGVMAAGGIHAGDIPNLHVPEGGALTVEAFLPSVKVADVTDTDGGAVVIHTKPDDYQTQPSGDAGERLACGVFAAS